mmetsp:Transcript_11500/g.19464  ORF Transcript_11500/g.19464 Transcript_11500/m.19464 type:complete len:102 (+) Transcript_11500:2-307(+)
MRITRRLERERGDKLKSLKYKCPVYLCKEKYAKEEELLAHYNESHSDLVRLGLELTKSKALQKREKQKQASRQANRIANAPIDSESSDQESFASGRNGLRK